MKAFGLVTVFRTLPTRISRLHELAYNLWWSWHPEARALYSSLDPDLWEAEGYFQQRIPHDGTQQAFYDVLHFSEAPILPVYDEKGAEVMISVDLPGRPVFARLRKVQVGRIPLYLMDTDVLHNNADDRKLTARLYGGERETRISQEILLGIGADLWLNNPIRPYEASGTSGQKAALNGLPNCSILDGWWAEGYNGENGWAIGEEREYDNDDERDEADSQSLYALLEEQIIPTYYDRGPDSIPHSWIAIMKEAICTCAPAFSMRRMVKEYTTRFYVPEIQRGICIEQNHYQQARELAAWEDRIRRAWPGLGLYVSGLRDGHFDLGAGFDIHAWVRADTLHPEDIGVDVVCSELANGTG